MIAVVQLSSLLDTGHLGLALMAVLEHVPGDSLSMLRFFLFAVRLLQCL